MNVFFFDFVFKSAWRIIKLGDRTGRVAQAVEYLSSKLKVLGSNPNTTNK
jgi:hypothetical protein